MDLKAEKSFTCKKAFEFRQFTYNLHKKKEDMQIYACSQHIEGYVKDTMLLFAQSFLSQQFLVPIRQLPMGSS